MASKSSRDTDAKKKAPWRAAVNLDRTYRGHVDLDAVLRRGGLTPAVSVHR